MPQKNNPFFSVIIPVYNVESYLGSCVESVLTQDLRDSELILVDDGSTDKSGEICDQYKKTAAHVVKVIHQPNAGLSAARNAGVAQASGEYLIFLDGDDSLEANALAVIRRAIEPGLEVLRYQAQEIFPDGRIVPYTEDGFATMTGVDAFKRLAKCHYTENAWLYAYQRSFFVQNKFRYAEGRIAEDFGLTPLILARAKTVKAISDICYNYRQRKGSIMHDSAKLIQRSADIVQQLHKVLPEIAAIPHTEPILHYLIVSFLVGATELQPADFLHVYREAKKEGLLSYVHPASLKSLPRAVLLKYFPRIFYRAYHP